MCTGTGREPSIWSSGPPETVSILTRPHDNSSSWRPKKAVHYPLPLSGKAVVSAKALA